MTSLKGCLADQPQEIIDNIAKYLDLEDLLRLQRTCAVLYWKCLDAQRLLTYDPGLVSFNFVKPVAKPLILLERNGRDTSGDPFVKTRFRVRIGRVILESYYGRKLRSNNVKLVTNRLGGRGIVEELSVRDVDAQPRLFNEMLEKLSVQKLDACLLTPDYLVLPQMKKLRELSHVGEVPMPADFFADARFQTLNIRFQPETTQGICSDLHPVFERWIRGEINDINWDISGMANFHPAQLFGEWRMVDDPALSRQRPLAVNHFRDSVYYIIRADEKKLCIRHHDHHNRISISQGEPPSMATLETERLVDLLEEGEEAINGLRQQLDEMERRLVEMRRFLDEINRPRKRKGSRRESRRNKRLKAAEEEENE